MSLARASLHDSILSHLRERIVSGAWPPGYRIPSEMELCDTFSCSRMTVNKALTQLQARGMIERRRKAGSFVAQPRARAAVLEISDIRSEAEAFGAYRFTILARRERALLPGDAGRLDTDRKIRVLEIDTLHFGGEQPFCLERRLINLGEVPEAADEAFSTIPPGSWLVAQVPFSEGEHRLRSEAADAEVAARLAVTEGAPCFVIERRTWRGGEPITHVRLDYPGPMQEMLARFGGA
jgi:GntR family histidine utilization transcriptional repressor